MVKAPVSGKSLLVGVAALALCGSFALAQDAPESLLPPGFDDPAPTPSPTAAPQAPTPGQAAPPATGSQPTVQPLPGPQQLPAVPDLGAIDLSQIPSLEALEEMSPDELDDLLGLKPRYDIPPGARRSLEQVGLLSRDEGGLPMGSLARQPASLVRAALAGMDGPVVSRWGHILLRRTLASRLNAPEGMSPVEFAALRAQSLNGMGEYVVARALVQDVDTGNYSDALTDAALEAYIATADIAGACPVVRFVGSERDGGQWTMLSAICNAYAVEGALAGRQLDRALRNDVAPRIDVLLAQRVAGAAGRGRRAVSVEWDEVEDMNPWRFALASAVGEPIPENLRSVNEPYYQRASALAPMLPLEQRIDGAMRAAREGVFSADAMVALYALVYADDAIEGDPAQMAVNLRAAYVAESADARLAAMQAVWAGVADDDYGAKVLTAYAAARLVPEERFAGDAAPVIASMLAAGLDRDAAGWLRVVDEGSEGWALLQLARANGTGQLNESAIDTFIDDDASAEQRKSQFLIAGLAGLGRASQADVRALADRLDMDLTRQTKWARAIQSAARYNNAALVSLLAGLGMQGSNWDQMTALHLYNIVAALNSVGLQAEARMIAAEAVARG